MMNGLIQGRVYVAMGRVAGAALTKVASPVVVDDDNLLLGPSRVDPKYLISGWLGRGNGSALLRSGITRVVNGLDE